MAVPGCTDNSKWELQLFPSLEGALLPEQTLCMPLHAPQKLYSYFGGVLLPLTSVNRGNVLSKFSHLLGDFVEIPWLGYHSVTASLTYLILLTERISYFG